MAKTMNFSIVNALWAITVGEALDPEDPRQGMICEIIAKAGSVQPLAGFFNQILPHPSLAKLPILSYLTSYKSWKDVNTEVTDLVAPYIVQHQKTLDPENTRDFLDAILVHVANTTDETSSFYGQQGLYSATNILVDLLMPAWRQPHLQLCSQFCF